METRKVLPDGDADSTNQYPATHAKPRQTNTFERGQGFSSNAENQIGARRTDAHRIIDTVLWYD